LENPRPFLERKRMTLLAEALADRLNSIQRPLISNYDLFLQVVEIYRSGTTKYLRGAWPSPDAIDRTKGILRQEGIIRPDNDYPRQWRIMSVSDAPADEIVCLSDPHCYISHISAMQRYGITQRRPEALHITKLRAEDAKALNQQRVVADLGKDANDQFVERLTLTHHPTEVRKRPLSVMETSKYGEWIKLRGLHLRVSTIGQTFLDTIQYPDRCGGIRHVLEVWEEHSKNYLEDIIRSVDGAEDTIVKLRAGYILDERLNVGDQRIENWQKLAQRGGSRVLQPGVAYSDKFSKKWMLSINV
jgi:predicted transcriptional regulator of viral defense system